MEGQPIDAHGVGTGEAVGEAEYAARGAEQKIAAAAAPAATRRGRDEAEAVAPTAGKGERIEAVGAEQEERRGGAEEAEMEVAQAARSRWVAVVVAGWRLHRHEVGGRELEGEKSRRREGEPWIYILYLFPPFISHIRFLFRNTYSIR